MDGTGKPMSGSARKPPRPASDSPALKGATRFAPVRKDSASVGIRIASPIVAGLPRVAAPVHGAHGHGHRGGMEAAGVKGSAAVTAPVEEVSSPPAVIKLDFSSPPKADEQAVVPKAAPPPPLPVSAVLGAFSPTPAHLVKPVPPPALKRELTMALAKCSALEGDKAALAAELAAATSAAAEQVAAHAAALAAAQAAAAQAADDEFFARCARASAERDAEMCHTTIAALQTEVAALKAALAAAQAVPQLSAEPSEATIAAIAVPPRTPAPVAAAAPPPPGLRVVARLRPLRSGEDATPWAVAESATSVQLGGEDPFLRRTFAVDAALGPATSQGEMYRQIAPLVAAVLTGRTAAVLAYGATGSGKTHTMVGGTGPAAGLLPRALAALLEATGVVQLTLVEVYNDTVHDLLAQGARLSVRHGPAGGYADGAASIECVTPSAVAAVLAAGLACRRAGRSVGNAASSRSHLLACATLPGSAQLWLVDLAGSESAGPALAAEAPDPVTPRAPPLLAASSSAPSLAAPGRSNGWNAPASGAAREGSCINKSLAALVDCVDAMGRKAPHVPWRNSKLTHLLQPCLGGTGAVALLIAHASPATGDAVETAASLHFAERARGVLPPRTPARRSSTPGLDARAVQAILSTPFGASVPTRRPSTAGNARRMSLAPAPVPPLTAERSLPARLFFPATTFLAPAGGFLSDEEDWEAEASEAHQLPLLNGFVPRSALKGARRAPLGERNGSAADELARAKAAALAAAVRMDAPHMRGGAGRVAVRAKPEVAVEAPVAKEAWSSRF